MTKQDRISAFAELGNRLIDPAFLTELLIQQAIAKNSWFTKESILRSAAAIAHEFLDKSKLEYWLSDYSFQDVEPKRIGLVMAGNIPFVGFHDLLSVLISGHYAKIKLSERDSVLMKFIIDTLIGINNEFSMAIETVERLKDFEAVIATGSDTTANYFNKYFAHVPNIIRKNRHAVAVLHNSDSQDNLKGLGEDIFSYYGLGCRNVSKLYLERGFKIDLFFESIADYSEIIYHNKYKNNYDYNHALFLLNKETFFSNDFLLLREDGHITSRIASLNFEYFDSLENLEQEILARESEIQCVVSSRDFSKLDRVNFGEAQAPKLNDYADGVNTLEFINKL